MERTSRPDPAPPAAAAAPSRPQLPQLSWSELHELIGDVTSRLKLRWKLPMRRVTLLREARRAARRSLQVSYMMVLLHNVVDHSAWLLLTGDVFE